MKNVIIKSENNILRGDIMKFSKKFFSLVFCVALMCMNSIPSYAQNYLYATTSNTLTYLGTVDEMNRQPINQEMIRDESQMNPSQEITDFVLTEEEVFEALAYTYDDVSLQKEITSLNKEISNGRKIYIFDSTAYFEFTDGQYGGLYIDENGNLVICYTDGEIYNKMTALNARKSNRLSISQNKTISYPVEIKKVAYGYNELKSCCENIASIKSEYSDIGAWGIDNKNNRVYVSLYETATSLETRSALISIFGENILSFDFISSENKIKDIANIEN